MAEETTTTKVASKMRPKLPPKLLPKARPKLTEAQMAKPMPPGPSNHVKRIPLPALIIAITVALTVILVIFGILQQQVFDAQNWPPGALGHVSGALASVS